MSDAHESESPESSSELDVESEGVWREERLAERLAGVLLRVLGVYFVARAIIFGAEEAVRLFVALRVGNTSLNYVLPRHWTNLTFMAAEFAVGAYLLFGGRWVFVKVLMPVVPRSPEDDDADVDQQADDSPAGTDDSPSTETE